MRVSVEFVKGVVKDEDFPTDRRYEVAFVGRSNVGKSRLINSLLGCKIARTGATPGRTQQVNFFLVNDAFYFVDLPGYGYSKLSKAKQQQLHELIEKYLARRKSHMLTIILVDCRHPPSEPDLRVKALLEEAAKPFLVALTKCDKLSNNELKRKLVESCALWGANRVIACSAMTGLGRNALWKAILSQINA